MYKPTQCVLSIAGTDPSGGAGIQADIKAISATGCFATTVITALVAQNTQGVQAIYDIDPAFIVKQLDSVFTDINIRAVKIGMLHRLEIIESIAVAIERYQAFPVVLDPVMVAKNGSPLLEPALVSALKEILFPKVYLITPNLFEAEQLLNASINTKQDMLEAARTLAQTYKINVLLKGGHLESDEAPDFLLDYHNNEEQWLSSPRIKTKNTHGTGCSLSAAIASYLAQGASLYCAVERAKDYLYRAILAGSYQTIGHGCGPVDHFYFLRANDTIHTPVTTV